MTLPFDLSIIIYLTPHPLPLRRPLCHGGYMGIGIQHEVCWEVAQYMRLYWGFVMEKKVKRPICLVQIGPFLSKERIEMCGA